jgi:hypothetical protein
MHITFHALEHHERFGNPLLQIAVAIGAVRRNHCDYILPLWTYSPFWGHPLTQTDNVPVETTYVEPDFSCNPMDVRVSTNLKGYYQSEKYFKHCERELRHDPAPNDSLATGIASCQRKLLGQNQHLFRQCSTGRLCRKHPFRTALGYMYDALLFQDISQWGDSSDHRKHT